MSIFNKPDALSLQEAKGLFSASQGTQELKFTREQIDHVGNMLAATFEFFEQQKIEDRVIKLEETIKEWYIVNNYADKTNYRFEIQINLNRDVKYLAIHDGTCNVPGDITDQTRWYAPNTKELLDKAFEFFETESVLKQKEIIRKGMKSEVK